MIESTLISFPMSNVLSLALAIHTHKRTRTHVTHYTARNLGFAVREQIVVVRFVARRLVRLALLVRIFGRQVGRVQVRFGRIPNAADFHLVVAVQHKVVGDWQGFALEVEVLHEAQADLERGRGGGKRIIIILN